MRLGCSTILYGGHPIDVALERIAAAGFGAVELCAITGMAPHLSPDATENDLRELRRLVAGHGLAIESIGASGRIGDPAQLARLIKAAAALGAPAVTTGSGGTSDDEESFRQTVAGIWAISQLAAQAGVTLSVKPHVRQAVYDSKTALRLMREVDPRHVGLNFDASHIIRAGEDPVASLAQLGEHVATARIRDAVRGVDGPGDVERQVPGSGDLDMSSLAGAIAALPRPHYAVLEIVGTRDWSVERVDAVVRASRDGLKAHLE